MLLDGIELPDDLDWTDEWTWQPHPEQAQRALDGSLQVERGPAAVGGRPVTLEGGPNRAWTDRATLDALRATLARESMPLTLWDGREKTVQWRLEDGPLQAREHVGSGHYHTLILRLREV